MASTGTGFVVPTLRAVVDRVSTDLDAYLPGAASRLLRRVTRALAVAVAGASYTLHAVGGEIAAEILPDRCSSTGVLRWAGIFRIDRDDATQAAGSARFTGDNGTALPAGAFVADDDARTYEVTTGGVVAGGVVDVVVEAVVAGIDGNAVEGVVLTLTSPITGLNADGAVLSPGIEDGTDEETIEALRTRVLERMGLAPQGGSFADYRGWVRDAVANTRAVWIEANTPGPGHVTIRFVVEPGDGDPANAIPSTAQIQAAQDYIGGTAAEDYEDAAAPVPTIGDRIDVRTLTGQGVAIRVDNLTPDTSDMRAAVEAALLALYLQRGEPGGTLKLSTFYGAIDGIPGEVSHEIGLIDGLTPADVSIDADKFPVDGGITYDPP